MMRGREGYDRERMGCMEEGKRMTGTGADADSSKNRAESMTRTSNGPTFIGDCPQT